MTMKRLMLVWVMILCLVPLGGWAEEETSEPLFPAMGENEKWGYINRSGEFVIAPQFDYAQEFRGNYAVVTIYPDGYTPSEDMNWTDRPDCQGIIDRSGSIVLEPTYSFDSGYDGQFYGGKDTGIWRVNRWREDEDAQREGFFDIPSGYFSGLIWQSIWGWCSDSRLIPVMDDTYRAGYADRTTGELVIPCQYFSTDPSVFHEGVAAVAYEDEEGEASDFFLIDETGAEIPLPEGISAVQYEGACEGRVIIAQYAENSGCVMMDNVDDLYGYADPQGNIVIPPQFIYVNPFQDGFAVVRFPEGDWACIDPDGQVLVRGLQADHWSGPDFQNGMYACKTGDQEFSLIDMQGQTVMTFTYENLVKLYPPDEDGICLFATDTSGIDNVWCDRQYGSVDLTGRVIAEPEPFGNSSGPEYENGLAFVRMGDQCGYIDEEGREVYFWDDVE